MGSFMKQNSLLEKIESVASRTTREHGIYELNVVFLPFPQRPLLERKMFRIGELQQPNVSHQPPSPCPT